MKAVEASAGVFHRSMETLAAYSVEFSMEALGGFVDVLEASMKTSIVRGTSREEV